MNFSLFTGINRFDFWVNFSNLTRVLNSIPLRCTFSHELIFAASLRHGILNCCLTIIQRAYNYVSGKSKEAEMKRINKELANIRNKFKGKKFVYDMSSSELNVANFKNSIILLLTSEPGFLNYRFGFR